MGLLHLSVDWGKIMLPEIIEDDMYVYFWLLRYEDEDLGIELDPVLKIGITKDWVKRRSSLLVQLEKSKWKDWLELGVITSDQLLGVIKGGRNMEKYLHNLFKPHALGNEFFWYEKIEQDVDDILDKHCNCTVHALWDHYARSYA